VPSPRAGCSSSTLLLMSALASRLSSPEQLPARTQPHHGLPRRAAAVPPPLPPVGRHLWNLSLPCGGVGRRRCRIGKEDDEGEEKKDAPHIAEAIRALTEGVCWDGAEGEAYLRAGWSNGGRAQGTFAVCSGLPDHPGVDCTMVDELPYLPTQVRKAPADLQAVSWLIIPPNALLVSSSPARMPKHPIRALIAIFSCLSPPPASSTPCPLFYASLHSSARTGTARSTLSISRRRPTARAWASAATRRRCRTGSSPVCVTSTTRPSSPLTPSLIGLVWMKGSSRGEEEGERKRLIGGGDNN